MVNSTIYLKESQLSHLPPTFSHALTPAVYAEFGFIPSAKGPKKKCIIGVTVAGISFFRPNTRGHTWKLSLYVSTYDLTEVVWVDPKRRELIYQGGSTYFMSDHADDCVSWLLTARQSLFLCSTTMGPIALTNYQGELRTFGDLITRSTEWQIPYIALCRHHGGEPSPRFVELFGSERIQKQSTLILDPSFDPPVHFDCILSPLLHECRLKTLVFKNWMPFGVCRLAHFLMKRAPSIRTLVFEGYSFLVPAQLRLEKIKGILPLSLTFNDCPFSENLMISLIDEVCTFKGNLRQFVMSNIQLSAVLMKHFFKSLRNKCWRKVEILELNKVDYGSIPSDRVMRRWTNCLERCRFLQRFSISSWSPGMHLHMNTFAGSSLLSELILCDLDMAQPFLPFVLPRGLSLLDVSRSHFTAASLQSFFKILASARSPLSLILQDLVLPEAHWRALFKALAALDRMATVVELDWSGNPLLPSDVEYFTHYFFNDSAIRFFSFGRIFGPDRISELEAFVGGLSQANLVGISVHGSAESNFGGNIVKLTDVLGVLDQIKILDITGQKLTDADLAALPAFFEAHTKIT
jgi:hypothetical protein